MVDQLWGGRRKPGPASGLPCTAKGCDKKRTARGMCNAHYRLWRRENGPHCSVEGCEQPVGGREWCDAHYANWRTTGDPIPRIGSGARTRGAHHNWTGDEPTYAGVHLRLARWRGSASSHPCAHCEGPSEDWAYDGLDPDERVDAMNGLTYSTDVGHYIPLCRKCHRKHDGARRDKTHCRNGHEMTPENTWVSPKTGHHHCRTCLRAQGKASRARRRERRNRP